MKIYLINDEKLTENTVQKFLGKIFEVKRDINEEKMEMVIKQNDKKCGLWTKWQDNCKACFDISKLIYLNCWLWTGVLLCTDEDLFKLIKRIYFKIFPYIMHDEKGKNIIKNACSFKKTTQKLLDEVRPENMHTFTERGTLTY